MKINKKVSVKPMEQRGTVSISKNKVELETKKFDDTLTMRPSDGTSVVVSAGVTVSENFSSVRIDVGVTVPTFWNKREAAAAEGWQFVDKELSNHLKETRKILGKITGK